MSQRILIAAATLLELKPLFDQLELPFPADVDWHGWNGLSIRGMVTGAGIPMTTYQLGKTLVLDPPDLLIHIGISGAQPGRFSIGQCVRVAEERFADIGAETADGGFLDMFKLKLWDGDHSMWTNRSLRPKYPVGSDLDLPAATAITVNTIPGSRKTIEEMGIRYEYDLESMEGAAVFQVALGEDIPFICLRGISNAIEPRNRAAWDIQAALESVTAETIQFLNLIQAKVASDVNILLKNRDF
ncbi:MAG: futalosine hydrolase [Saprospiraceae bacterium]|nr:futalosine hydrolase [Saprospiraceae bacterium]